MYGEPFATGISLSKLVVHVQDLLIVAFFYEYILVQCNMDYTENN